jgi:hypothetical protein
LKWNNLPLEESSDELNQELPCILHLPSLLLLPYWKHSYPVLAEEEEEAAATNHLREIFPAPLNPKRRRREKWLNSLCLPRSRTTLAAATAAPAI